MKFSKTKNKQTYDVNSQHKHKTLAIKIDGKKYCRLRNIKGLKKKSYKNGLVIHLGKL